MSAPYHQLFVHCVWTTFERLRLVEAKVEARLYAVISAKCETLKSAVIALGGVEDHLHLLARLSPALSVADLVGEVKGASSHSMNREVRHDRAFKWQGGYGAFTVSKRAVGTVAEYVRNQKTRHAEGRSIAALERTEGEANS